MKMRLIIFSPHFLSPLSPFHSGPLLLFLPIKHMLRAWFNNSIDSCTLKIIGVTSPLLRLSLLLKKKNFWENYIWEVKQDEIKILIVTYGTMQGEWYLCLWWFLSLKFMSFFFFFFFFLKKSITTLSPWRSILYIPILSLNDTLKYKTLSIFFI